VRVLAVIPVYNHAATLRGVVQGVLDQGLPVLVVDDGSTDGALASLEGLDIQRWRQPRNLGKGRALLRAAALAGDCDAILTLDADGQHDPADAPLLLEAARAHWPAIVIGARRMAPGRTPRASRFGRAFSNFWVRLECGRDPVDSQSGYRIYPVAFLRSRRFRARGYGFEVEVLVRAAWARLPLVATPVSVHYPPGAERISHFRPFLDNLRLTGLHGALLFRALLPWPHRPGPGVARERARFPGPGAFLRRLLREHTSPGELAASVGLGICVGALPIIPFGLATLAYLNHKLRLNQVAGAAASNLFVAPVGPFLCIQAGHLLRYGRPWSDFNRATLLLQAHQRLWEWLLGSLVLGPLLGALGALLTLGLARAWGHRAGS